MQIPEKTARFEQAILPHLNSAYNLARWLVHGDQDARDMVQEACLRAFTFFDGFHGEDGRAWLLAIVRNTCYTWLKKQRAHESEVAFDEQLHSSPTAGEDAEVLLLRKADREMLSQALERLPAEFREILVLRELEGMSYHQIATIADVPIGTVMSRLARARQRLERDLVQPAARESRK